MFEALIANGLGLLAKVGLAKGKDWLKEKTGVDLDKAALAPEDILALQKYQMDHETELLRLTTEAAAGEDQAITQRWQADMASTSWLSQNVRPMVLLALILMVGAGEFAGGVGVDKLKPICDLATIAIVAYFGSRMTEKGVIASAITAWKGGRG